MLKRKSILLGILVIVSTFGFALLLASMREAPKEKEIVAKEIIIPVQCVENEKIDLELSVVGNLEAQAKVDVYAEVSGILESLGKPFLEGVKFTKGERLLVIKNDKYKAEVYSERSSFMNEIASILPDLKFDYPKSFIAWQKYLSDFEVEKELAQIPEAQDDKEKYFLAGSDIYTSYYTIKSMEQELKKYEILVPFTGEVLESDIKPGTLVMTGEKLGEFSNISAYDLVVGIDLNNLSGVKAGNVVRVYSSSINRNWEGIVRRISNKIDEETQMVNVYISVSGKELKEGMFLNADIELEKEVFGIEIPRKLLVKSEFVYVVDRGIVNLKKISVIQKKENSVIIEGLENGVMLALKTSGIHEGISVSVRE